jgi:lipopolysaccharide export LptBFGC system permease protein LptF
VEKSVDNSRLSPDARGVDSNAGVMPSMRLVLDRLIIREVLPPSIMGFAVYTFLLVMRGLFSLMEQVFVRGVAARDAFRILAASLPHVVVLTIPMAFLFGVLIAMGRLTSDNEIIALQAAGIPARRLLRPVLLIGALMTVVNGWIYLDVLPRSNREMRSLKTEVFTSAKNIGRIEPRVFYEEFPNLLLYVEDVDSDTFIWRNVFVYDTSGRDEERLVLARRGRVISTVNTAGSGSRTGNGADPWLLLEDVVTHHIDRRKPETYRRTDTQEQRIRPRLTGQGTARVDVGVRERSTQELWTFVRGGDLRDLVMPPTPNVVRRSRYRPHWSSTSGSRSRQRPLFSVCSRYRWASAPVPAAAGGGSCCRSASSSSTTSC